MSQQLISRNEDLKRLRDDGFDVEITSGYLLVKSVPYVNAKCEVQCGILVSQLDLAGEATVRPTTHVAYFAGEYPCNKDGSKIRQLEHTSTTTTLADGLVVNHSFSNKPAAGYSDYYEKMTTYVRIISHPAQAIDSDCTALTFPVIEASPEESVFRYLDTASSRAGIMMATKKLELGKVAIVGLGGTGGYVLDLVAKTPVKEIHLFDGDTFLNHNAFRSPGAASLDELTKQPRKVAYFHQRYSHMHRGIIAHDYYIDESNAAELGEMDFVFLCLDKAEAKQPIIEVLEAHSVSFVDVGMGVELDESGSLGGVLRVTTSTIRQRGHVRTKARISFSDMNARDDYDRNIQIADLNAMNAALAVIKWKKLFGFYRDLEDEHFSAYTLDGNAIINEDIP